MAWLSDKERRKIDDHISELQARLGDLESSLKKTSAERDVLRTEKSKLEGDVQKLQNTLKLDAQKHQAGVSEYAQKAAALEKECDDLSKQLTNASAKLKTLEHEKASLAKDKDTLSQVSSNNLSALAKDRDDLKAQLQKIQSELTASTKARAELDAFLQKVKSEHDQAKQSLEQSQKALEQSKAAHSKVAAEVEQLKTREQALAKELEAARAQAGKDLNKAQQDAAAQITKLTQERDQLKADSTKLSADLAKKNKEFTSLQAAKEDATQENELLLLQLMQAQEELVEYYEEKNRLEKLYDAYKARWDRLEQRYPNYIDFGGIELLSFDAVSEIPSITWRVKDFAQGGMAYNEFLFQTVMQDGLPGLTVINNPDEVAEADSALVPKLLQSSAKQIERFMRYTTTEFRQLRAAATVLAQLEAVGWKDFTLPSQFDLAFWRPILKQLVTQVQALPAVLRYDVVKLKRELINPDYEHLWLEFQGLNYGNMNLRKFEARLGAALVQAQGFSQFPKFEIPLIDGKTKPFESWFAESQDDSGAKLELRFSLEKNAFDAAVWAKLSDIDKAFMLRLIYAFPEALKRLEAQHASIHRPWTTWIDFAKGAVGIFEANRKATQAAVKADKAISAEGDGQGSDKTTVQTVVTSANGKTSTSKPKVINISEAAKKVPKKSVNKPVSTPKAAPKAPLNKKTSKAKA